MFVEVLPLSQDERRDLLQEKQSVVCASGSWLPSEVTALQQKIFHLW